MFEFAVRDNLSESNSTPNTEGPTPSESQKRSVEIEDEKVRVQIVNESEYNDNFEENSEPGEDDDRGEDVYYSDMEIPRGDHSAGVRVRYLRR